MTRHPIPPRPRLFAITWPIFSEHLLHALVGLLFVWLTARISDDTAAAFGLSNQIMAFFIILFRLVGVGASVVITQYLGARDGAGAERIARASLGAAVWLGLASGAVVALGAGPLLSLMQLPEALRPEAQPYLVILGFVLCADAVIATMSSVLRAHTHTRDTLRLMVGMYVVSLAAGLPLMFGFGPIPKLGLVGIGLGFLFARIASVALHLWLWRLRLQIRPHGSDWWRLRAGPMREMAHIGLPGAGENVAYRIAFTWVLAFVAAMGSSELATHTYLLQVSYFILLTGLAIGFGTEIVVGHQVGAGHLHDANTDVKRALAWGLGVSTTLALVAALCGRAIFSFFTDDPTIIAAGSQLLWVTLVLEPGRAFNLVVINALRATGDARFPVGFGVFSMFGVAVGVAWLLGVHAGWGLLGVWIAMAADEWVRGIAMYIRWRRLAWVSHARATRRRILAQQPTYPEPVQAT
ncbi:MATE family efflux transporter [Niveibacterium umoris]|uniref:Putative MATE family efflux protein n=1 Tax=Niveibacterium umoris TaxID=1193620 RepID=A0A840BKX6_9RHOO|nr:MATE family efflux transporter [Niveibacterium umoris]MBB4013905.1 putative MATE family efflux protein [Niveibacterium umoris]